jgi:hypothetical protein
VGTEKGTFAVVLYDRDTSVLEQMAEHQFPNKKATAPHGWSSRSLSYTYYDMTQEIIFGCSSKVLFFYQFS